MFQAAFVYLGGSLDSGKDRAVIRSANMEMHVVGCRDYAQAEAAARELAAGGCTAVELCAGFGPEGIARVQRAVGPEVAVGAVHFSFHPALEFRTGDSVFG